MVDLYAGFQWGSVFEKMTVILSKTIENPNKMVTILLRFPMVRLWNGRTTVMAIAMADHYKTKILEIRTSNAWYSNVFNILMFGIQAPTIVSFSIAQTPRRENVFVDI